MRGAALAALVLALAFGSLTLGRETVGAADLWQVATRGWDAPDGFLVMALRLPRLLVAAGAGAAFGLSGIICQSLMRNPLAAPDLIGVTAGASMGAVALLLGPAAVGGLPAGATAAAAAGGAVAAGGLVLALSRGAGSTTFILSGIGIGLVASALTQGLLIGARDQLAGDAMLWLVGSVRPRG